MCGARAQLVRPVGAHGAASTATLMVDSRPASPPYRGRCDPARRHPGPRRPRRRGRGPGDADAGDAGRARLAGADPVDQRGGSRPRGGAPFGRAHGGAAHRRRPRGGRAARGGGRAPLRHRPLAPRGRGQAHRAALRPPRRPAGGDPGPMELRPVRTHRAGRATVRPGHRGRQGRCHGTRGRHPGLVGRPGPAAGQRQGHRRGRGGDRLTPPAHLPRPPRVDARRRRGSARGPHELEGRLARTDVVVAGADGRHGHGPDHGPARALGDVGWRRTR